MVVSSPKLGVSLLGPHKNADRMLGSILGFPRFMEAAFFP